MEHLETEAVDLLCELIAIDSINPALVPGAAGEADIVAFLHNRLRQAGFACTVIHPKGHSNRPSLVAIAPGPPHWPTVILNGHLDTVGVAGMDAPFTPTIVDDRLYGRGAADMKSGVACIVAAAEHLVSAQVPIRPVLVLVSDEEDASLGSEAIIADFAALDLQPTLCLIAEPTDLAISRSLRGFGIARVDFPGRAAHSSQPQFGVNAVAHMGDFIHAITQRSQAVRARGGELMVTLAHGGSSVFVIPDSAECVVEIRTTPDGKGSDVLDEIAAQLDPDWAATASLMATRDGWRLDIDGPAANFATDLGAALSTGPTFDAPYWMEAPLWQPICPTLICGPSGGGLHAIDEWVDLEQVRRFTTGLVKVLADWADAES